MAKEKKGRKHIPNATRLKLWIKSGGRCQLKHCNKPVYEHGMTLSEGNFADVAHIIGAKINATRGNKDSKKLQIEYSNLMLLCKECHKMIDDYEEKYGVEKLREWKEEHENRIEILTSVSSEIPKSTILRIQINIGDRKIEIPQEAMINAMFNSSPPKYPADKKGISITEKEFDRTAEKVHWQYFAENRIKKKISRSLDIGISEKPIQHLSIFGVAPMPLLMYMGKCIGDTIQADIFHAHRNIRDTNQNWTWKVNIDETVLPKIKSDVIANKKSKNIALLISLSDQIELDKYQSFLDKDFAIYRIYVDTPSLYLIQHKRQIEEFSRLFRDLLNKLQAKHGKDCNIYIVPATPACIAIEAGRVLLPTKDPNIFVCEIQPDKSFKCVLQLI